jgi:hypothetical protein
MYYCDRCNLWEHEHCLSAAIKADLMKHDLNLSEKALKVEIINDQESGKVMAALHQDDDGTDETGAGETGAIRVNIKCLECGQPL